jgi:hypothetical protein
LEEAVDLSSDRLLMMMMISIINIVALLKAVRTCLLEALHLVTCIYIQLKVIKLCSH